MAHVPGPTEVPPGQPGQVPGFLGTFDPRFLVQRSIHPSFLSLPGTLRPGSWERRYPATLHGRPSSLGMCSW